MNTATVISPQNAGKGQVIMTIIDNGTDLHKGFTPAGSRTTGVKNKPPPGTAGPPDTDIRDRGEWNRFRAARPVGCRIQQVRSE